jgi:superfamily II DNA or RNA helicase
LELIQRHLCKRDVDSMLFHGGLSRASRTKDLYERFRFGGCPNLLATLGVTQKGLNLPQADHVIMLSRSWSATVEDQAQARPLRPQQTKNVRVEFPHLKGSIDIYKAQVVGFKSDSAASGLDWATPETEDIDFLHLDTVIDRFVRDLAAMRGVTRQSLRASLRALA